MTVVLVVLCLTVGVLELYAGRQSKRQADAFLQRVDELRIEVTRQQRAFAQVGDEVADELSTVKREVIPSIDKRLRRNAGEIDRLNSMLQQAGDYLRAQAARLQDLERQKEALAALRSRLADIETSVRGHTSGAGAAGTGATARTATASIEAGPPGDAAGTGTGVGTGAGTEADAEAGTAAGPSGEVGQVGERVEAALNRIAELERGGDQILELQRELTRTLEDVEDVVTDLLRYTEEELDHAVATSLNGGGLTTETTVPGRLGCPDAQLFDIITEVYERCVHAQGMTIRFKTPEDDQEPGRLRYFLTGRDMEELGGGFSALLISIGLDTTYGEHRRMPPDEAALQALLRTAFEGVGTTLQIGPLVIVRSLTKLQCGVLSHAQSIDFEGSGLLWDPAAAGVWLGRLPVHQYWDLTEWAARPASGAGA